VFTPMPRANDSNAAAVIAGDPPTEREPDVGHAA
jgi:hypothetical protein